MIRLKTIGLELIRVRSDRVITDQGRNDWYRNDRGLEIYFCFVNKIVFLKSIQFRS